MGIARGCGGMNGNDTDIPRRLLVTLRAYVREGSHKAGAYSLGISESTSRQRMSELMRLIGARTAAEAVWLLRQELGDRKTGQGTSRRRTM